MPTNPLSVPSSSQSVPDRRATARRAAVYLDDAKRETVLTMKGTPEWKEWLCELAESSRTTVASTVDSALSEYARVRGFRHPPVR